MDETNRKLPPGVYWRHHTLWISYYATAPDGRRVKRREATKATSPREAARLRSLHVAEHERGERSVDAHRLTVADVLATVLANYEANDRSSLDTAKGRAKVIEATLGANTPAERITTDVVERAQARWRRAGRSNVTINHYGKLLRRGLRLLWKARRIPFVPYIPALAEHSTRGRYITSTDADALRDKLPDYVRDFFTLALSLPNRRGQLSRTLRRYVDLDAETVTWPAAETKAQEEHPVPLDGEALEVVRRAMADVRAWCPYLFHGPHCAPGRKPSKRYGCIGDFKKAWKAAGEAAGIALGRKLGGYVFHHTRNTAATDLRAGGLSEDDCMRVGGWKTRAVFQRYNLGDVEALRERLAEARDRRGKVRALRRSA